MHDVLVAEGEHHGATVSAFAPPRQHIRTDGVGAENRSMCITLLVSTASGEDPDL